MLRVEGFEIKLWGHIVRRLVWIHCLYSQHTLRDTATTGMAECRCQVH
jgi:hypothetical protein